jgi:FixJ family two-component response regulator
MPSRPSARIPRSISVITDVIMPGLDGGQLIRALRALAPELRILTISGYSGDLSARDLPEDVTWLQKPFSSTELLAAVIDALPRSQSATA